MYPSYLNPMMGAQQRLAMLEQQYPQFSQQQPSMNQYNQQYPANQQNFIKGRPVANAEEANAAMIDLDGSIFVFPDIKNNRIYTKQLGMDGNIIFKCFCEEPQVNSMQQPVTSQPSPQSTDWQKDFVRKEDFDKTTELLIGEIDSLQKALKALKGGTEG